VRRPGAPQVAKTERRIYDGMFIRYTGDGLELMEHFRQQDF
jgi:hypothetical protein